MQRLSSLSIHLMFILLIAFQTTHVVCINFIRKWRDLQFNVDYEQQICENLFHGSFILLTEEEIFSYFRFSFFRTLCLISQNTTYKNTATSI